MKEFLLSKQFLTRASQSNDPLDVVRSLGGLQAGAEYEDLWNRVPHFKKEQFDRLRSDLRIIEMHVLRQALRTVVVEDLPFFCQASKSSVGRWIQKMQVKLGVYPKRLNGQMKLVKNSLREGRADSRELKRRLGSKYERRALYFLLLEREVVRATRSGNYFTYALLEDVLPSLDCGSVDVDDSMKWVAMKYLDNYGPASISELARYIGWMSEEARRVLDALKDEDRIEERKGEYLSYNFLEAYQEVEPSSESDWVRILDNDDELHLSYLPRIELFGYKWRYNAATSYAPHNFGLLINRSLVGMAIFVKRASRWGFIRLEECKAQMDEPLRRRTKDLADFLNS